MEEGELDAKAALAGGHQRKGGRGLGVAVEGILGVTFGDRESSDKETRNKAVGSAQAFRPAGWEASEPLFAELWCGHGRQGCRSNPQAVKPARRDRGEGDDTSGNEGGRISQEETEKTERSRTTLRCSVSSVSSCSTAAFTMIEIAISLAVIGFALVAIIGILPAGMNVQKENRQETIINQDMTVLMNAIRNGEKGLDDLTNYVRAITNYQSGYDLNGVRQSGVQSLGYTYSNGFGSFALTNGYRIVGILTTPKFTSGGPKLIYSNYVVAFMRAMSGPAQEKFPQVNADVLDLAFNYRVATEVVPYAGFDFDWTNYTAHYNDNGDTNAWKWRSNYWRVARTMQTNLYDVRLLFRWPLTSGGNTGPRRQVYRTLTSGHLFATNEPGFGTNLYFFEPRTYVQGGTNY